MATTQLQTDTKVSPALAALNQAIVQADGALQRSGGTLTVDVVLAKDATADMQPVTKKQLDAVATKVDSTIDPIIAALIFGG